MENNNRKVFSNLIWRLMERFGAQGVTFVVSIVLARILDPKVYGIVALVTVFTSILQVFIDSGFGSALIQKKDADDLDFSSVFYFNIVICLFLYLLVFFCAPLIAKFYNMPDLTPIVRVVSLILIISGVKNVQQAYVSRNFLFKKFFFATLGGTIGAAVVGIVMAVLGFGVWALVAQMLFNTTVDTIILWITVKWRPQKQFSLERLKALFSYGWKLLAAALVDTGYNQIRHLIIGKKYTAEDLAFYNKGDRLPNLLVININSAIDSVIFPSMSAEQDDIDRVRNMTKRAIKVSSFVMWPMMVWIGVCAPTLISLVLTDKWLPCVPFMRVFCFTYAFWPIHTANLNAIKALGRSDSFLKIEILKKVIGFAILMGTMWFGVRIIAYGLILETFVSLIANTIPTKRLLQYGVLSQIKDILPYIALSAFMGGAVFVIQLLPIHRVIIVLFQLFLGILIYLIGSKLFRFDSYEYIMDIMKSYIGKLKRKEE